MFFEVIFKTWNIWYKDFTTVFFTTKNLCEFHNTRAQIQMVIHKPAGLKFALKISDIIDQTFIRYDKFYEQAFKVKNSLLEFLTIYI